VSSQPASPGRRRRGMPPRALVVFVAFAVIALLASRTCGSAGKPVTQQQAVEIARKQIDYQADGVNVRFLRRGVSEHPFWAVSLWTRGGGGGYDRITVVVVDAEDGSVAQVNRERPRPGDRQRGEQRQRAQVLHRYLRGLTTSTPRIWRQPSSTCRLQ